MAARRSAFAFLFLAVIAALCCHTLGGFVSTPTSPRPSPSVRTARQLPRGETLGLKATGVVESETADEDSIELGGFAGFIVGVALLPYVFNCFYVDFKVIAGDDFTVGPFGLSATSCLVTVGLVFWSVGSFVQRGRGLPAGPLGLLGLSEGLSYIAVLGLAVAGVASAVRTAPNTSGKASSPTSVVPAIKAPEFKAPDIKVPGLKDVKVPDFKAPDIKMPDLKTGDIKLPEFKAPDIKVPEFKAPDIKIPDVKMPAVKVPEVKVPEVKVPEVKVPEVKLPTPAKTPEPAKKPEPSKAPEPAKKAEAPKADYDDLFD